MRTPLFLALALLLLPTSAMSEEVSFTWVPFGAGADVTKIESTGMDLTIDMFVGDEPVGSMKTLNKKDDTVRAVKGVWTPKKKQATISFGENGATERQNAQDGTTKESKETTAVSGKSYSVLARKGKDPVVTYVAGGAVPGAELALVMEEWEQLSDDEPGDFESALVGKTLTVGDTLDSDNAALRTMLGLDDDELSVTRAAITLTEVREVAGEKCAVFSMEVTLVGKDGPITLTMQVKGEAILGVTGLRTHSVTLVGPITMVANMEQGGVKLRMSGGGDLTFSLGYAYGE